MNDLFEGHSENERMVDYWRASRELWWQQRKAQRWLFDQLSWLKDPGSPRQGDPV